MGRPKKMDSEAKRHQCRFRVSDETKELLEFLSRDTNQSKTEVFEKALKIYEIVNDAQRNMDKY